MVQIIERLRRKDAAGEIYIKGLEYLDYLCVRILNPDFPKGEGFQSREVTLIEGGEEFRVRIEYGSRNPSSRIGVILENLEGFPYQVLYLKGFDRMITPDKAARILERPGNSIWNLGDLMTSRKRPVEPDEVEEYKRLLEKVAQVLNVELPSRW